MTRGPPPELFTENGEPVRFFLHGSLTRDQQNELRSAIEAHGGDVHYVERDLNTIIAHDEVLDIMRAQYSHSGTVYVEDYDFVFRCIRRNEFRHELMPAILERRPIRNEFTPEDDQLLVRYIATRMPRKGDGGRGGNQIYKELCSEVYAGEWGRPAEKHPWQSWRNRYTKFEGIFDRRIEEHLRDN